MVAIIDENNNIKLSNSIFSTSDKTPFFRNIEMGLPSCYIGGPNTDADNKVIKPLMYFPPSDPITRVLNELFVASMCVINVLSIALHTIGEALVTYGDFYITTPDSSSPLKTQGFTTVLYDLDIPSARRRRGNHSTKNLILEKTVCPCPGAVQNQRRRGKS